MQFDLAREHNPRQPSMHRCRQPDTLPLPTQPQIVIRMLIILILILIVAAQWIKCVQCKLHPYNLRFADAFSDLVAVDWILIPEVRPER